MDAKKRKEVLAREGIVLLILLLGIIFLLLGRYYSLEAAAYNSLSLLFPLPSAEVIESFSKAVAIVTTMSNRFYMVGACLIIGYFYILFFRFIYWRVKTLKNKQVV